MAKKVEFNPLQAFDGLNKVLMAKNLKPLQSSADDNMLGIRVESLAFQWMLGTTALPLSRSIQLVGSAGSCKSTLAYEFGRWFIDSGGLFILTETESKDSGYIRNGIMRWDKNRIDRTAVQQTVSYQQWMSSITRAYAYFKEQMATTKQYFPLLICVDSITAAASEESLEKITKEGCAQPGYPDLAKNLSADFKSFPEKLNGNPFAFLFINHIKPGTSVTPYTRGNIPGGKALDFYNSLTIHLSSTAGTDSADGSVHSKVMMKTYKNSNGKEGRSITVNLVRWSEPDPVIEDGHNDYVAFDWASTDIEFLLKLTADPKVGANLRNSVKDLLDLHSVRVGSKNGIWSEALDIPKEEPCLYPEAGKKLHDNPVIMRKLQNILLIRDIPAYSADVDYKQLVKETGEARLAHLQQMPTWSAPPSADAGEEESDEYIEDDYEE